MNIDFYCPRWGAEQIGWKAFARQVKQAGFVGIEVFPLPYPEQKMQMLHALEEHGLSYILLHDEANASKDFASYLRILEQNLRELCTYQAGSLMPSFIVSQTGREYYSMKQMKACFDLCNQVSQDTGIPIVQETHRNKWSFAAHIVHEYLHTFPELRLALDISHWICVSESYLEDQEEAVGLAIQHTRHLHARVGHKEGPQVSDPRAPENAEALAHHLKWWDQWIGHLSREGIHSCSITPEFGSFPYMAYVPFSTEPIANQWEINCWMKDFLQDRYSSGTVLSTAPILNKV